MPSKASSIGEHFGGMSDSRSGENVWHPMINIMTIAICGAICGADNWVDIEMFGTAKQDRFASFLDLKHGSPSHDRFGRVFRKLDPDEFQERFWHWTAAMQIKLNGEVLSVGPRMACWNCLHWIWSVYGRVKTSWC